MDHTRHMNLFSVKNMEATLIGAGGVGAATALCLTKMGLGRLHIFDFDKVDEVNLATQLHKLESVGEEKVLAVKKMLEEFSDDTYIQAMNWRFGRNCVLDTNVVISAVDTIKARQEIWQKVIEEDCTEIYLDARMSAETFHLYCVYMNDWEWYDEIVMNESDEAIPDLPCTSKATMYCAFASAAVIGSAIKSISINKSLPKRIVFDVANFDVVTM